MSETRAAACACQGVGPAVTAMISNMGPKEAGKHFRAARVEFLKGIRSLLDARIEQLSRPPRVEDQGASVPID